MSIRKICLYWPAIVAFISFSFISAYASAAEQKVQIDGEGRGLIGILNLPAGVGNPPVVLMLSGFTNDKNGFEIPSTKERLFALAAERLAESGVASFRLDFSGSGESKGKWEDTTFTGQLYDAALAFGYLQALKSVDGSKVTVLGYSQGGLIAAHLAAAKPEASSIVLWAPVVDPVATYTKIMGHEAVTDAISGPKDALTTAPLIWGGETKLRGSFFHELPYFAPLDAVARYPGPLLVVVGDHDDLVSPQPAAGQRLLDSHQGEEELLVVDADHFWNAGATAEVIEDVLIPRTIDWLVAHF